MQEIIVVFTSPDGLLITQLFDSYIYKHWMRHQCKRIRSSKRALPAAAFGESEWFYQRPGCIDDLTTWSKLTVKTPKTDFSKRLQFLDIASSSIANVFLKKYREGELARVVVHSTWVHQRQRVPYSAITYYSFCTEWWHPAIGQCGGHHCQRIGVGFDRAQLKVQIERILNEVTLKEIESWYVLCTLVAQNWTIPGLWLHLIDKRIPSENMEWNATAMTGWND